MTDIGLDLRGPNGGGDGATDSVTVTGTNGDDAFGVAGDAGGVTCSACRPRSTSSSPTAKTA